MGNTIAGMTVGIDVGGTNTDAVILDPGRNIVAQAKCPTQQNTTETIRTALKSVLQNANIDKRGIRRVMLGTTHATNAIVGGNELGRVALIRLAAPATTSFQPLSEWPVSLRNQVLAGSAIVAGGFMVDGTPIATVDPDEIETFLRRLDGRVDSIVITGVFSPSFPSQELEAKRIVENCMGEEVFISLSHEIGPVGLAERENATVLNAALNSVANEVFDSLLEVINDEGLTAAEVYFAQNDGTLMGLEHAARFPVLSIGSGPANSIRGAALLSGVDEAVVVDIGGTTTDLGIIVDGFPRESTMPREIGGVRTNFRMPDVISIAVGGGTRINFSDGTVGPDSLGFRLQDDGLVFGGKVPTLTDAAVYNSEQNGGAMELRLGEIESGVASVLSKGISIAHEKIREGIEQLTHGKSGQTVIVVGGGSMLAPAELPGVVQVLYPEHGHVANAVGAAISYVGGRSQGLSTVEARETDLQRIADEAKDRAVAAGADLSKTEIVEIEETPISYSAERQLRISVKAVGPLVPLTTSGPI